MFRRTLCIIFLGIVTLLFSYGHALARFDAQCLQDHRGLRLTAVQTTPSFETDRVLFAAADVDAAPEPDDEGFDDEFDDPFADNGIKPMPDPLEVANRPLFVFNDKMYFWVLKPVSRGYGWIIPEPARKSVKKCFYNLRAPIRIVNCLLQGKGCGALTELYRFGINTTIGIAGLFDPATSRFHLKDYNEDFGLTLGHHMGSGFYLSVPFMGPSSFRDGIGSIVDTLIVPTWYVISNYGTPYLLVQTFEAVNSTSLSIGDYEDLIESAIDPYVAVRDAYHQHREDLIKR